MVWRNNNEHFRRRLPSIIPQQRTFPTLECLNFENLLSPALSIEHDSSQLTSLKMIAENHHDNDDNDDDDDDIDGKYDHDNFNPNMIRRLSLSNCKQKSWPTTFRLSFPVRSNQRRELPIEDLEICGKFFKK